MLGKQALTKLILRSIFSMNPMNSTSMTIQSMRLILPMLIRLKMKTKRASAQWRRFAIRSRIRLRPNQGSHLPIRFANQRRIQLRPNRSFRLPRRFANLLRIQLLPKQGFRLPIRFANLIRIQLRPNQDFHLPRRFANLNQPANLSQMVWALPPSAVLRWPVPLHWLA